MSSVGGSSGTVQVPAAALQQIMAALEKHDTQQEKIETQLGQLVAGQLLEPLGSFLRCADAPPQHTCRQHACTPCAF